MAKTPEKTSPQKMAVGEANKPLIWDCGSSLYDSFELKSFERQLDSAISARSLSMPHLPDRRVVFPPSTDPQQQTTQPISKKTSRISRSFQKLLKSVFRAKQSNSPLFQGQNRDGFYVVYDKSGALTTIPEGPEYDAFSPEIKSLVRRTGSERFTATPIGISCA